MASTQLVAWDGLDYQVFVLVISVGVSRPTNRRVSEILAVDMQRDFSKEAAAFSKQKCIAPEASSYESRKTDGERDLNTQDNVFHLQFGHVWKRFKFDGIMQT